MRKMIVLAIVSIATLFVSASGMKNADVSVFEGRKMVFKSFVVGEELPRELHSPVFIEFNKAEGKVSGSAACNRFFGSYTIEGDQISFGQVGSTRMMCDPVSNEVEMKMMKLLNGANRFETRGGNSVVFFKDAERLGEFVAEGSELKAVDAKPYSTSVRKEASLKSSAVSSAQVTQSVRKNADASVFEGRKMVLKSFVVGEKLPKGLSNPVFVEFNKAEGKVSGSAACNRFFGSYTIEGDNISFGKLGSTMMMCDPVSNEVEMKMMKIFNDANRFETRGSSVVFFKDAERLGEFVAETRRLKVAKSSSLNSSKVQNEASSNVKLSTVSK